MLAILMSISHTFEPYVIFLDEMESFAGLDRPGRIGRLGRPDRLDRLGRAAEADKVPRNSRFVKLVRSSFEVNNKQLTVSLYRDILIP